MPGIEIQKEPIGCLVVSLMLGAMTGVERQLHWLEHNVFPKFPSSDSQG